MKRTSDSKTCASCGRPFTWRRKWAEHWSEVKFCSRRCRSRKVRRADHEIETLLLAAIPRGASPGSIDPVKTIQARRADLCGEQSSIERIHRAARRLAQRGQIELLQGKRVIAPGELRAGVLIRQPGAGR